MHSRAIVALVAVGLFQLPADAHHSFAATYDANQVAHVEGRVVAVRWMNPHVSLTLDVADISQKGTVARWTIELSSPTFLLRNGLTKDDIQPGMELVIDGPRSKSGDLRIGGTTVTFKSTGRVYSTPTTNSFRDRVATGL
jgi:hypothetical protein